MLNLKLLIIICTKVIYNYVKFKAAYNNIDLHKLLYQRCNLASSTPKLFHNKHFFEFII